MKTIRSTVRFAFLGSILAGLAVGCGGGGGGGGAGSGGPMIVLAGFTKTYGAMASYWLDGSSTQYVYLDAQWKNIGGSTIHVIAVEFYLQTTPAPPPASAIPYETVSFENSGIIGPGMTVGVSSLQFGGTFYKAGVYYFFTRLITQEGNLANNQAGPLTVPIPSTAETWAELSIEQFSKTLRGDTLTYRVQVRNTGATSAGTTVGLAYDVSWISYNTTTGNFDGLGSPSAFGWSQTKSITVPAGQSAAITFDRIISDGGGSERAWAFVDPAQTTNELDEGNNLVGPLYVEKPLTVSQPPGTATTDLYLSNVTTKLLSYQGVATVLIRANLTNSGPGSAPVVQVGAYFDPGAIPTAATSPDDYAYIGAVGAGQTVVVEVRRDFYPGTSHTIYLYADPGNWIPEFSESNNLGSVSVDIPWPQISPPLLSSPELAVTNVSTTSYDTGLVYTVEIQNSGASTSAPTNVQLYYNIESEPGPSASAPNDVQEIPSIPAGSSVTVRFNRSTSVPTQEKSYATVSPTVSGGDSNTGNDTGGIVVSPPVTGAWDLAITRFEATPTDAAAGADIKYTVEIKNVGDQPSGYWAVDLVYHSATPVSGEDALPGWLISDYKWAYQVPGAPGSLAAGETVVITFVRKNAPVGNYRSYAYLDTGGGPEPLRNNAAGPRVITVR